MGNIKHTKFSGLFKIDMPTFADTRGFFREVFRLKELDPVIGKPFVPIQMNHSRSIPGTIRALHAEHWNKLIYPVSGQMFAALVDVRPDSSTFSQVITYVFDKDDHYALYIPQGIANSICAVGPDTVEYIYLVDAYYSGTDTTAIAWDDPDLAIKWPISKPLLSDRDQHNPKLKELFPEKFK